MENKVNSHFSRFLQKCKQRFGIQKLHYRETKRVEKCEKDFKMVQKVYDEHQDIAMDVMKVILKNTLNSHVKIADALEKVMRLQMMMGVTLVEKLGLEKEFEDKT